LKGFVDLNGWWNIVDAGFGFDWYGLLQGICRLYIGTFKVI
jgi:hypothetical protein